MKTMKKKVVLCEKRAGGVWLGVALLRLNKRRLL